MRQTAINRRCGGFEVTLLKDGAMAPPASALLHIEGEEATRRLVASWGKPAIAFDVHCFALRTGDGVILVDAGGGPALGPAFGQARTELRALGVEPQDVRAVLLTHLHNDHVLGLLDAGTPDGDSAYFPAAEILVPQTELAFFTSSAERARLPEARRGGFVVAERLLRTYGARVKAFATGAPVPGIEARHLPGHTPGHTGYLLGEGSDRLLLCADTFHVGSLQVGDPGIGLVYDVDPLRAAQTRSAVIDEVTREGWLIAGGHIGFSRLRRTPVGIELEAA